MNQDTDMTKRIFIATFISFVFFMAYDYLYVQPQTQKAQEILAKQQKEAPVTPKLEQKETPKTSNLATSQENGKISNIVTVKAKQFELKIDSLGRISSFVLLADKFEKDGKRIDLVSKNLPKPLEMRFSDKSINKEVFTTNFVADEKDIVLNDKPKTITLTQTLSNLEIKKIITIYPDGHYDLKVHLSKDKNYFISNGFRPDIEVDVRAFHGAIIKKSDDTIEMVDDGDAEEKTFKNAKIASSSDMYYTTFLYDLKGFDVYETVAKDAVPTLYVKGSQNLSIHGYIGAKYVATLKNIDPSLVDVVDYGVITFIAKPMFYILHWFYNFSSDWAVSIILLTILIRVVLFPLTLKGMVSMYKMKELAPKLKEIQAKYKDDKQKLQVNMMKLYKEEGANPLGGCLPMLLQIPIFFSIYRLLLNSIELKGESFLWIHDLTLMDPYFILPVLMGASMFVHQLITPNNFQDPMQAKIFKFLPIIFTFFFIYFPAGLVLYWTVNNILSVLQQFIINKYMETKGNKK